MRLAAEEQTEAGALHPAGFCRLTWLLPLAPKCPHGLRVASLKPYALLGH